MHDVSQLVVGQPLPDMHIVKRPRAETHCKVRPCSETQEGACLLILRWPGILIGVLFIAAALSACSDSTGSTPPTNGDSGAWEEYEAFCSEAAQEALDDNEDYTNGEVSAFYARLVERLESIDPPAEIADWHDRNLAGWTAVKKLIDAEPQDAIFDPFMLFLDNEILSLFEEVGAAWDDIPADARERLAAAGCSDDADTEPTGDGEADTSLPDATAPADTGQSSTGRAFLPTCEPRSRDEAALVALYNATDGPNWRNNTNWLTDAPLGDWSGVSANRITSNDRVVGECVTVLSLGNNQLIGEMPAELGNLLSLERLSLNDNQLSGEIPVVLGSLLNLQRLDLRNNQLSGEIPVELGAIPNLRLDGNQLSGRILRPNGTNPQYTWDGSTIRVSWDAVDGADYYKVYHDYFFGDECSLRRDGRPRFCEELATNVVGTTYVHANRTSPVMGENYYWVVSCNSDGCSEIDSYYPAQLIDSDPEEAAPGDDSSTATPRGAPTPTQIPTPSGTPISPVTSPSARDRDGDGLIEVDNLTQLDAIRWDLDGDGISDNADYAIAFSDVDTGTMCSVASCAGYELTANLDFDTNGNGEADEGDVYWNSGGGWITIGESNDPFDTTFEGGGRTISNLYIRRSPNVGLFGVLGSGSTVSGIGLVDTNVGASGYGSAGALAGIGRGVIEDSFAVGLVAGCVDHIGGLVGLNDGSIANSRSAGNVTSARKPSSSALGVINDLIDFPLFGSGSRTCNASGGGLVGENSGTIASSHSTSVVSGFTDNFGGLAGTNSGVIAASYATGSVSGRGYASVGGLVGANHYTGVITAAYAEGSVSGRADRYGGLLGWNQGVVTVCFSTGEVPQSGGGLIERNGNYGKVANCYWDTETSDQSDSAGGEGKTTAELQSPTGYTGPYADWNVDLNGDGSSDDPWSFGSASEYPVLNLGTPDIAHGNLNARSPLEPKSNAALCSAVNYSQTQDVRTEIAAGIDVNDTCQSTTFWYDGLTPLVIAQRQGGPEIEAILVEAGAVDGEG